MRAKLKRLHSPDIDLSSFLPEDPTSFGFLLQFFAGPDDEPGDDSFSITVCTLSWLEQEKPKRMFFGSNHLIVPNYDLKAIESFLARYCERCIGATWAEVALKLSRVARWEFEDYQPFPRQC